MTSEQRETRVSKEAIPPIVDSYADAVIERNRRNVGAGRRVSQEAEQLRATYLNFDAASIPTAPNQSAEREELARDIRLMAWLLRRTA